MYVVVFPVALVAQFWNDFETIREAATASAPQNYGVEPWDGRLIGANAHGASQRCGRLLGTGMFESCYSFECRIQVQRSAEL